MPRTRTEVKLWNGQDGMRCWEWPDGEERGRGITINPRAMLQDFFQCPSCKEFADMQGVGIRADERGMYYCRKCGEEIVAQHSAALDSEMDFKPIHVEVPTEYMQADILLFPAGKQGVLRDWPMKRPLLGICGVNGAGKTMALYAIYKNLARRGRKAFVMICSAERSRWSQSNNRDEIVERWIKAPWLLVDDITAPPATDGWKDVMHNLLSARLSHRRPTLITTHSKADEVNEKYGPPICSRLSAFEWLALPSIDWRKRLRGVIEEEKPEPTLFDGKMIPAEPMRALKIIHPTESGVVGGSAK